MGILNITPDSFSDGGRYIDSNNAINHALKMIDMGADIIDIGGESTRPGSDSVSIDNECQRIIPVIKAIKKINSEILISVDTYKSFVAKRAIDAGADIVNDISGLTFDHKMLSVLSENDVPIIIMHINGRPKTMQDNPLYNDLIKDIRDFLLRQANLAEMSGIKKSNIILDPGIGFGKCFEHNFTLIRRLNEISSLGYPLMIGPSRKAFIGDALGLPPEDRIEGTLATVIASIMNGANIIRVHDVKETKRAVIITERILSSA
ncbi:MAG: dihydropteroate synthase [bacterium TMED217]|nr:MAG: dihydropteroate synthase [bacterium TMED217]|tara:strand:+ start:15372 stop:16157 length:786 start_codon:yes stop_codon:yes gene_type:complete